MERRKAMLAKAFSVWVAMAGLGLALPAFADDEVDPKDPQKDAPATTVTATPNVENGDLNASGDINLTDVVYMVNWLFQNGPEPVAAACEPDGTPPSGEAPGFTPTGRNGDLDGDGRINITDVLRLVNFLYLGGAAPAEISCENTTSGGAV